MRTVHVLGHGDLELCSGDYSGGKGVGLEAGLEADSEVDSEGDSEGDSEAGLGADLEVAGSEVFSPDFAVAQKH